MSTAPSDRPASPRPAPAGGRRVLVASVLAVAALVVGAWAALRPRAPRDAPPAQVHLERGGLRYEFDALTGRESLLERLPDGAVRDVLALRPDDARRLREDLLRSLGLNSLSDLQEMHREAAEELRRLGYL